MAEPITMSELQRKLDDPNTTPEELAKYLKPDPKRSMPYKPAFTVNERTVVLDRARLLGLDLDSLNERGAKRRQQDFDRRVAASPDGIRLLAEGDSWFEFPVGPPIGVKDLISHLLPRYPVYCVSAAGDTLQNMVGGLDRLEGLIASKKPHAFLFSGGGNDIAGPEFKGYLKGYDPGFGSADYISVGFSTFMKDVESHYNKMLSRLTRRFPKLKIYCHGYDWSIPRANGRFGVWLWPSLESLEVPLDLRAAVVALMIDRFNEMLKRQAALFEGKVTHIDCRGLVTATRWFDELHPDTAAFSDIARKFIERIDADLANGA